MRTAEKEKKDVEETRNAGDTDLTDLRGFLFVFGRPIRVVPGSDYV